MVVDEGEAVLTDGTVVARWWSEVPEWLISTGNPDDEWPNDGTYTEPQMIQFGPPMLNVWGEPRFSAQSTPEEREC